MSTKRKGDIAEIGAAKKLVEKGYSVSFPFGDNERYDLIYDKGDQLLRAQIRKATKREDYLVFKCYSNHRSGGPTKDYKRIHDVMDYDWMQKDEWQKQLQTMIDKGVRVEQQALASQSLEFVAKEYLPNKIENQNFLD